MKLALWFEPFLCVCRGEEKERMMIRSDSDMRMFMWQVYNFLDKSVQHLLFSLNWTSRVENAFFLPSFLSSLSLFLWEGLKIKFYNRDEIRKNVEGKKGYSALIAFLCAYFLWVVTILSTDGPEIKVVRVCNFYIIFLLQECSCLIFSSNCVYIIDDDDDDKNWRKGNNRNS